MKLYWPCGTYLRKNGKVGRLASYDACMTLEEAVDVLKKWEIDCGYQMLVQFVQITESGKKIGIYEHTRSGNPEEQFEGADEKWAN